MPTASTIGLFLAAAVALFVVPGPAVLYVTGRSVAQGRTAGLVSVLGIHAASLVHVAAAMAGLTAVVAASASAFAAVKWAGAVYLVYLAVRAVTEGDSPTAAGAVQPVGLRRVFVQGFVVNLLNPKTAVFFVAFVPQFVDPAGAARLQLLVLGALFVVAGLISDGLYAVGAGRIGRLLRRRPHFARRARYLSAGVYATLAVVTVVTGRRPR